MSFTTTPPSFAHLHSAWEPCESTDAPFRIQALDWYAQDRPVLKKDTRSMTAPERRAFQARDRTPNEQFAIDVFGVGAHGETCVLHINDCKPHFFIELPPVQITDGRIQALLDFLQTDKQFLPANMRNELHVAQCAVEHYKAFRGYQWGTAKAFLKLVFHSSRCCKKMATHIEKGCKLPRNLFPDLPRSQTGVPSSAYHYFPLYESNTEAVIRFLHERDLNPSGWMRVNPGEYHIRTGLQRESGAFVEVECQAHHVHRETDESVGKLMIASFDIEADSSHGDFPVAVKDYTKPVNEIIQLYLKLLKENTPVSVIKLESWLKHIFGIDQRRLDAATKEALSRVFVQEEQAADQAPLPFHETAVRIATLINAATVSGMYEGDVVNVHTPGKTSTEKDNVIDIKTAEHQPNLKLYFLKKKQVWVRLMDADGTKDNTAVRIARENGFRPYGAMTSMEQGRRKTGLHTKLTKVLQELLPPLAGDKVIQIGTVFWRYGDTEPCLRHLIALDTCDPIEGVVVECYRTEKEVLLRWSEVMRELAPNIVTGYNIFGFDYKFMWERADVLGVAGGFGDLSPLRDYTTTTPHRKHQVSDSQNRFRPAQKPGEPAACTCAHAEMRCKLIEKVLHSAGLGENRLFYMDVPGMVQIDMLKDIMKDHTMSSYRLDDVASHFIHGNVLSHAEVYPVTTADAPDAPDALDMATDETEAHTVLTSDNAYGVRAGDFVYLYRAGVVSEEPIANGRKFKLSAVTKLATGEYAFELGVRVELDSGTKYEWGLGKDDVTPQDIFRMQKEGSAERAVVGKYCVQDCQLVLSLMMKLQTVSNNLGMSKVCCVPFQYIFTRGQGIKTFSLLNRECTARGYRIPHRRPDGLDVLKMSAREQDCIHERGFRAMEEREDEDDEKETYEGAVVLDPKPGVYLQDAVAVLDYSSLYPSSIISHNLCASTIVLEPEYQGEDGARKLEALGLAFKDVTYANYKYVRTGGGKQFTKTLNKDVPTVTCRFIQPPTQADGTVLDTDRGITPQTLSILLSQRKATKNRIKTAVDPFACAVLDGLQLAYKVTANSVYGGLGASTSNICFKQIAASTTAVGRELLLFAKTFVEKHFEGAEIVYGDTDSIFINFHPKDAAGVPLTGHAALARSIELGAQAGKMAKKHLQHPHDLEYEKTFHPFVLLSKKRYVGMKYEHNPNKGALSYMGIVLKRRDNPRIVKIVYADVIESLMKGKPVQESIIGLHANIKKLVDGEVPLEDLVLSKALKSHYANPEQIVHKVLADRMAERDPGNKPQTNDRLPYAYIDVGTRKVTLQGERVEHPDFIRKHGLKIDAGFYISNQISRPVSQIYALVLEQLPAYKHRNDPHFFDNMRQKLREVGRTDDQIAKKIDDTRVTMASEILFERYTRVLKNRREGSRAITDFFRAA